MTLQGLPFPPSCNYLVDSNRAARHSLGLVPSRSLIFGAWAFLFGATPRFVAEWRCCLDDALFKILDTAINAGGANLSAAALGAGGKRGEPLLKRLCEEGWLSAAGR